MPRAGRFPMAENVYISFRRGTSQGRSGAAGSRRGPPGAGCRRFALAAEKTKTCALASRTQSLRRPAGRFRNRRCAVRFGDSVAAHSRRGHAGGGPGKARGCAGSRVPVGRIRDLTTRRTETLPGLEPGSAFATRPRLRAPVRPEADRPDSAAGRDSGTEARRNSGAAPVRAVPEPEGSRNARQRRSAGTERASHKR